MPDDTMKFASRRWRDTVALLLIWGVWAFVLMAAAVLYGRDVAGLGPNNSLRSSSALLEDLPREFKLVMLVLSAGLVIPYTACLALHFLKRPPILGRCLRLFVSIFRYSLLAYFSLPILISVGFGQFDNVLFASVLFVIGIVFDQTWRSLQDNPPPNVNEMATDPIWQDTLSVLETRRGFRLALLALLMVYVLAAILIGVHLFPDGTAYMQIARNYAEGKSAIRGHWSPLISWLIAIPIAVGFSPERSAQLVMILAGAGLILATARLSLVSGISRRGTLVVTAILTPLALNMMAFVNADLLSGALLVMYFGLMLDRRLLEQPLRWGLLIGVVAALAYLAKAFNLVFIVAHLVLHGGLLWVHGYSLRRFGYAVAVIGVTIMIVAAPWVIALESRYGTYSITSNTGVSNAQNAPKADGWAYCNDGHRLCDEPDDVLFPWEDHLGKYQPYTDWSPFQSAQDFGYYLARVAANVVIVLATHMDLYSLIVLLLVIVTLIFWQDQNRRWRYSWFLLSVALYLTGYILTIPNLARYYTPVLSLLTVAAYFIAQEAVQIARSHLNLNPQHLQRIGIVGIVVFVLAGSSMLRNYDSQDYWAYCKGDVIDQAATKLREPIASIEPTNLWNAVQDVSYYTQTRTYGSQALDYYSLDEIVVKMKQMDVRTVLVDNEEYKDIPDRLISEFGYVYGGNLDTCNFDFTILYPPAIETAQFGDKVQTERSMFRLR